MITYESLSLLLHAQVGHVELLSHASIAQLRATGVNSNSCQKKPPCMAPLRARLLRGQLRHDAGARIQRSRLVLG